MNVYLLVITAIGVAALLILLLVWKPISKVMIETGAFVYLSLEGAKRGLETLVTMAINFLNTAMLAYGIYAGIIIAYTAAKASKFGPWGTVIATVLCSMLLGGFYFGVIAPVKEELLHKFLSFFEKLEEIVNPLQYWPYHHVHILFPTEEEKFKSYIRSIFISYFFSKKYFPKGLVAHFTIENATCGEVKALINETFIKTIYDQGFLIILDDCTSPQRVNLSIKVKSTNYIGNLEVTDTKAINTAKREYKQSYGEEPSSIKCYATTLLNKIVFGESNVTDLSNQLSLPVQKETPIEIIGIFCEGEDSQGNTRFVAINKPVICNTETCDHIMNSIMGLHPLLRGYLTISVAPCLIDCIPLPALKYDLYQQLEASGALGYKEFNFETTQNNIRREYYIKILQNISLDGKVYHVLLPDHLNRTIHLHAQNTKYVILLNYFQTKRRILIIEIKEI